MYLEIKSAISLVYGYSCTLSKISISRHPFLPSFIDPLVLKSEVRRNEMD